MENLTQQEISERLGISRIKVVRMLKEAREQGIVEIKVQTPVNGDLLLEGELRKLYRLTDAYVIPETEEGEQLARMLTRTAAQLLEQRLCPGLKVGIGLGRTTAYLPEYFNPGRQEDCTFISLAGGLNSRETVEDNFSTLIGLAKSSGGEARYIYAPFVVSNKETRDALMHDEVIISTLDLARKADLAIFSVGTPDDFALLHQYNLITDDELVEMRSSGALGDALGRFYDRSGQEIFTNFNDRVIGLTISELKKIPTRILVAGGAKKYQAILAAIEGNIANVLVTDIKTAESLIKAAKE
jgi:DNA-binding transcriptional regulator LsrR (DeoR family)